MSSDGSVTIVTVVTVATVETVVRVVTVVPIVKKKNLFFKDFVVLTILTT